MRARLAARLLRSVCLHGCPPLLLAHVADAPFCWPPPHRPRANSGGQKNLLIWGSFTVFFGLFMSGYLFH